MTHPPPPPFPPSPPTWSKKEGIQDGLQLQFLLLIFLRAHLSARDWSLPAWGRWGAGRGGEAWERAVLFFAGRQEGNS